MRTSLALIAALALAAPLGAQEKEKEKEFKEPTEIGGRSLAEWIKDISHKDPSRREMAIRTVLLFGPEKAYQAVPALLNELRKHTPERSIDGSLRVNLAIALGTIFSAKKDPDPKHIKDAVPLLIRLLRDSQAIVKFQAARAIAIFGLEARSATPDLLPLLREVKFYEVRQAGAMALSRVVADRSAPAPPFAVQALHGLLTDEAYQVRQAACQGLTVVGVPLDNTLKQQVIKGLDTLVKKDPEPSVQIWANLAVMSYSGNIGKENLENIAQLLHKGDLSTRIQAAQALGTVGSLAKEITPTLIGALADPDPTVVGWTIWALGRTESQRAVPELQKIAADKKRPEAIQKAAEESLRMIKRATDGSK